MFDTLSGSLEKVFKKLRGYGKLTDRNIEDALREVRLALLEADVNFQVAKDFVARVREKCLGEVVIDSISPGQQIVKRIHDELVDLLGRAREDFRWAGRPATVMLIGLHGAGKTTTAAKLARRWTLEKKRVLLVGCDLRRPAAVDQLRLLAQQNGVEMVGPEPGDSVVQVAERAMKKANRELHDVVILDTGGRFAIDGELVGELKALRDVVKPHNTVLVLDAAIGQESVNVAKTFHEAVGLTGLILTKLDGDARGGAALSVNAVTGCPILLVGTGEKPGDLEPFHPDRMASRILGMGDIVSLVEKAQEVVDLDAAQAMQQKLRSRGGFDFEDLLLQMRQMKKLGPLDKLLEMMPGANRLPAEAMAGLRDNSGSEMKRMEAIILSMTPRERRNPDIINGSRRARIARGSGTAVSDVNELLKRHSSMRKMMKRMKGRPRMPFMPSPGA